MSKKFKPLYTFASLWKQFVLFTKNWRRKPTGELVNKDKLELGDVTANDIEVRDIKCRKVTASGKIKTTGEVEGTNFKGVTAMETIKDRDGHLRFVEGNIDLVEDITGITKIYGKWSLSGSHLMLVLQVKIDNGASISSTFIGNAVLPTWIYDKLIPIASTRLAINSFTAYNGTTSTNQPITGLVNKRDNGILGIFPTPFTATDDRYVRFQFDFIIDNA